MDDVLINKVHLFEVAEVFKALEGQAVEQYLLEGDCPEIMSVSRVIDYSREIQDANSLEEDFPDELKGRVLSFNKAVAIIRWFGEDIRVIDFNDTPQSIQFIKKEGE